MNKKTQKPNQPKKRKLDTAMSLIYLLAQAV